MKKLLQCNEHYYSLYQGLKAAQAILEGMKQSKNGGVPMPVLETGNADRGFAQAQPALQTAISITRPVGLPPLAGQAESKRILAHHVDLQALAVNLRTAQTVVQAAELQHKKGLLWFPDVAIEFPGNNTEIVFTTDEYIALAKRALTDAIQRCESKTMSPEFSRLDRSALNRLPQCIIEIILSAFPLGELRNPAVRKRVTEAKIVLGFDLSRGFEQLIFFGEKYFKAVVDRGDPLLGKDFVCFLFHSELEEDAKLAAAVTRLKGACDLV